ncbi:deoxyribodipyrimidine photo-lyase, partial [Tremellales sp. Uapishka_1]
MPQLTLFADPRSKSLALSPQKATASTSAPRPPTRGTGTQPNLWNIHRQQEDMAKAAMDKGRVKVKVKGEDDAKGQPSSASKRSRSPEGGGVAGSSDRKKFKNAYEIKGKIAREDVAAAVDADPPLAQLFRLQETKGPDVEKGESVVFWMRMEDVRIEDSRGLSLASEKAKSLGVPLIVLFTISPGDYRMHDRSTRRIDFMLRNLRVLKPQLAELNIPLHVVSWDKRLSLPKHLVKKVLPDLKATHVFANVSYEVDELRRDLQTVKLGRENGIDVVCVHDRLVVPPGKVLSKQGKPMSVYSPWQRAWAKKLDEDRSFLEESPLPMANETSIHEHARFKSLFDETPIPSHVDGFECGDAEKMAEVWPEGIEKAKAALDLFLHTKARTSQLELTSPLTPGAQKNDKESRISSYTVGRNLVNGDNSSRLSPYLTSGIISGRMVINATRKLKGGKLESGRDSGVGMWVQEVAWRDFYNHVMAIWPRVSMGRPFLEKFQDVQWEIDEERLQAWKDGKTGFPIVDAAMRACNTRGWMENRLRMVAASFLVKGLMLDWRESKPRYEDESSHARLLGLGEKYFMERFIDGDLASNNGGWQWTASTGTDPQPYFRIFNTLTQSEKCDPAGDYIRYWVPELKNLKGKAIHDPSHHLPSIEFNKLGYPKPIIDHKTSRERALFRYKNVGEKEP